MRIIIYTGKGGVGKTSVAAASALRMAAAGKRVLVMSTDPAHSLGDSFDLKLGREPVPVCDNLSAVEIDTVYEGEKSWGRMKNYLKELLCIRGQGGIEVEELLIFPGLEELFSMFRILEFSDSREFDVIVVDCAPTGETLAMLKYPERLFDTINRVLPAKRKGMKLAGPLIERLTSFPMPEDNVFDDLEYLMDKMEKLQRLLLDKSTVSLRIVTTPERIVIREAKRNFTCLYLYNYNVDAIIVNRIYPRQAMEGYFSKWMVMQQEGLREIEESFSEVPRFYLELQKVEVRTLPVLERIGEELFQGTDLWEILFCRDIYTVSREGETLSLSILLPFADKEDLELNQVESELILRLKNETRRFPLPRQAQGKEIAGAKLCQGYLKIQFA